jgi:hypothetical protein
MLAVAHGSGWPNRAAGALRRAKLIRYRRGMVTILDRRGLENAACECYAVAKAEFDRLLGPAVPVPARRDAKHFGHG